MNPKRDPHPVPFTCRECPAYGTEACTTLEGLGGYCDVMLAASQTVARGRLADELRARRARRKAGTRRAA